MSFSTILKGKPPKYDILVRPDTTGSMRYCMQQRKRDTSFFIPHMGTELLRRVDRNECFKIFCVALADMKDVDDWIKEDFHDVEFPLEACVCPTDISHFLARHPICDPMEYTTAAGSRAGMTEGTNSQMQVLPRWTFIICAVSKITFNDIFN